MPRKQLRGSSLLRFTQSGCRELNPGHAHPKGVYCRYTTARIGRNFRRNFRPHPKKSYYRVFAFALMHLAQAVIRFPSAALVFWRLGYFRNFGVGLYFPRSLLRCLSTTDDFPHTAQFFAIEVRLSINGNDDYPQSYLKKKELVNF